MNAVMQRMRAMSDRWLPTTRRFLCDESGPTATEYAVLLALIIMASFVTVTSIGQKQLDIWQMIADATDTVTPM